MYIYARDHDSNSNSIFKRRHQFTYFSYCVIIFSQFSCQFSWLLACKKGLWKKHFRIKVKIATIAPFNLTLHSIYCWINGLAIVQRTLFYNIRAVKTHSLKTFLIIDKSSLFVGYLSAMCFMVNLVSSFGIRCPHFKIKNKIGSYIVHTFIFIISERMTMLS